MVFQKHREIHGLNTKRVNKKTVITQGANDLTQEHIITLKKSSYGLADASEVTNKSENSAIER
jgi:hypothetical protein